jgi:hypothetical protein
MIEGFCRDVPLTFWSDASGFPDGEFLFMGSRIVTPRKECRFGFRDMAWSYYQQSIQNSDGRKRQDCVINAKKSQVTNIRRRQQRLPILVAGWRSVAVLDNWYPSRNGRHQLRTQRKLLVFLRDIGVLYVPIT